MHTNLIENLSITVTFNMALTDTTVSDDVLEGLKAIEEAGGMDSNTLDRSSEMSAAWEWLTSNISYDDSYYWEYTIDDLQVKDGENNGRR